VEQPPVLRTYPEFEDIPEDCQISVYSLNEIATEKVAALQDRARNEPRDGYNLGSSPLTQVSKSVTSSEPLRKKSGKKYYWHRSPYSRKRSSPKDAVG
jgi:predicted nucleotidyltransferase component of viral defense system